MTNADLPTGSSLLLRHILAVIAGALIPLSFAPFDWWPTGLLGMALHYWTLMNTSARDAARLGLSFGCGLFGVGATWVYVSIHDYGAAPPPLAAFITLGFMLLLASYQALQCWAWRRWLAGRWPALTFAASWLLVESWRGWFLTGFPWLYVGYAHVTSPLSGWAPVIGVQGLGFVVALTSAVSVQSLVDWSHGERRWQQYWLLGCVVLLLGAGVALRDTAWTQPSERAPLRVGLIQGNIPQELKFNPAAIQDGLNRYASLSEPLWSLDMVVWPETAIPLVYQNEPELIDTLAAQARRAGTALVTGVFYRSDAGLHNSVAVLGNGSGVWHKQRLVPFGEYIPLRDWLSNLLELFELPLSSLSAGPAGQDILTVQGVRVASFICYEVVYPDFVRRYAAEAGVLLTISNDTWFGASLGPPQHLQMAAMRARELGRPMVRATNNGITAFIAPTGEISAETEQFQATTLQSSVLVYEGQTPYSRWGSWPLWLLSLALVMIDTLVPWLRLNRKNSR